MRAQDRTIGWSFLLLAMLLAVTGCSSTTATSTEQVLVVPGASGDGPWYKGLRSGLSDARPGASVATVQWGMPLPLYMLNLQDEHIHHEAEEKVAHWIALWRGQHPEGHLTIVAHSAGCGVALGALSMLLPEQRVQEVVLLAPSVSPQYDLRPALLHVEDKLHVFYSDRDELWLKWRTSNFGTYDNIKTAAAGHAGFHLIESNDKVVQHPYQIDWEKLDNSGTHGGALSRNFVKQVIAPLTVEHGQNEMRTGG